MYSTKSNNNQLQNHIRQGNTLSNLFSTGIKTIANSKSQRSSDPFTNKLPLSQIQNSIQKQKKKRSQSKSKSKSKENTPQKSIQRSSSYFNLKSNSKSNLIQKQKQPLEKIVRNSQNLTYKKGQIIKKDNQKLSTHINEITSNFKYQHPYQSSSEINSINRQSSQTESSVSMVWSQYQLPINSKVSQKNVRFKQQLLQYHEMQSKIKQNANKKGKDFHNQDKKISIFNLNSPRIKSPSILKKRYSGESLNSERGYSINSVNSSTKNSRQKPKQLIELQNFTINKTIKIKYEQIVKKYEQLNKNKKMTKTQIKSNFNSENKSQKNLLINSYGKSKELIRLNNIQMFKDDLFPPIMSSAFNPKSHKYNLQNLHSKILWKRIEQVFLSRHQNKQVEDLIVLRTQEKSLIKITKKQYKNSSIQIENENLTFVSDYFINSLNAIRQNLNLLGKIFQDQRQLNPYGVYILKIFQENTWKYIIIDDYIPVIEENGCYRPAFLNIEKSQSNHQNTIQIWPFLLQKAFASFYSSYQALTYGNELDFISEITGSSYNSIKIPQANDEGEIKSKQIQNVEIWLKEEKIIVIGQKSKRSLQIIQPKNVNDQKKQESPSLYYPILHDNNMITKKSLGFLVYLDKQKNFKPIRNKTANILKEFTKIHFFFLQTYQYLTSSVLCPIPINNSEGNNKKIKQKGETGIGSFRSSSKKKQTNENNVNNGCKLSDISLRTFQVSVKTNCILVIKQKQKRFYHHLNIKNSVQSKTQIPQSKFKIYEYIWIRAIIMFKQYNNDYRWIDGRYSQQKQIIFSLKNLQPGEYYILLMPQWNQNYRHDIILNLFGQSCICPIERKIYKDEQQIFQKGCADIAQRLGKLNQVNKYICSYNFVNEQTGLVIQNIHNERSKGLVTIMRSINGLKCQVQLIPVNKEFYFETNGEYENQGQPLKKMKKTIEVDIQKDSSFTVILKTKGGIDKKFFDSFDFGS